MRYHTHKPKIKIGYPVGKGVLYDTLDGRLLFGTDELYSAFNFLLQDNLQNKHICAEEFNNVASTVKSIFNEMWYKLREGNLWQRVVHNWAILEEYRERLRQHPVLKPYIRDAESFLRSN